MHFTFAQYQESAQFLKHRLGNFQPKVAMVLGSGLGYLGDLVEHAIVVPYGEIPHFKHSTAPGHKGQLVFGTLASQPVAVMQGRMHHYEGYSYEEVAYAVRVLRLLGCQTLFVTNAAGGVNYSFHAGDLMLITDQIKIFLESPLRGENLPEFGPRFPDSSYLYTPKLQALAKQQARALDIDLKTGVYMYFPGPQYETPAEIRMARILGADAVGMSTAPEVITAGHCGMDVLGITLVSNMAAGVLPQKLTEQEVLDAAEAKLDDRAVKAGAGLALAELIASGVTTIADMYMHTPAIAETVLQAGISANLSCGGVYFGAPADFSPKTCNDCGHQIRLTEEWHGAGDGQILVDASIHAEYTSNVPLWQWMAQYAQDHKLGMHVHLSETQHEHEACQERWGLTPFGILDKFGVWNTRAIAAHCVWTTEEDWAGMAAKGVSCVHNPVSNLKLGSGVAWIPAMKKAGVNIALGTDGVSSNNNTDMFEEMKFAAVLHNGVQRDPLALLPKDVLAMATRDGAKALGRKTGQIAPGYTADLILVDFDRPALTPCHSVRDNLVYSANGSAVVMNMARGKVIYKDGAFLTLDLDQIKAEVKDYALPLLFG